MIANHPKTKDILPLFKDIISNLNDKFILNSDNKPILDLIHDTVVDTDDEVTLVHLTFANMAFMDEERYEKYQSYHKNWDINPALNEDDFEDIQGIIEDTFQDFPNQHQVTISKVNCSDTAFSYEYVTITISIER
jgi:hypothetical protein